MFQGLDNDTGITPPDPTGDVGPSQYVQAVNAAPPKGAIFGVFNKNGNFQTGAAVTRLWRGLGGVCGFHGRGDPIVQYDPLARRWVVTQFAFRRDGRQHFQCVAVSTSSDATGSYYRYSFRVSRRAFPDFPKLAVWPDAYYLSVHFFFHGHYARQGIIALDRKRMLDGAGARKLQAFVARDRSLFGAVPADVQGPTPPPFGAPNYFLVQRDDDLGAKQDRLYLFRFHVSWTNPDSSAIYGPRALHPGPFDTRVCCIRQRGTRQRLDAVAFGFLGYPFAYRNLPGHESLLVNSTVRVKHRKHAGIRWYEIRDPGPNAYIYQRGTFAARYSRWVGSLGMDRAGDVALGYSASGHRIHPRIGLAGRLLSDPKGVMARGFTELAFGGSQTGSPRWGDYTQMSVDPTDDCTFWYTNEYYPANSPVHWHTAIVSFRFPSC